VSPRRLKLTTLATAVLLAALAGCGGGGGETSTTAPSAPGAFDADRAFADLTAQVDLGPRPSGSDANAAVVKLLAGKLKEAGVEDVRVQSPVRNVVGVIPGSEPGYVVVGAHHDTVDVPGFVGANDGASGVAVVLELARDLPNPLPGPSVAIALFDGEEARGDRDFAVDGKRGSTQYVDLAAKAAQGSPPLDQIKAMVLFDMVGDCDLGIPLEPSSDFDLYGRFAHADPDVFSGRTFPIDDDHTPFLERGIPAVDLIDFDYGPGRTPGAYWHTTGDTVDHVCPASLDSVGEAALSVIPQIR
jgi:Zn-dependent M28 family amino/carboxypeptidase